MTDGQFTILIVVLIGLAADRSWRAEKLLKQRLDKTIEILAAIRDGSK